MLLKELICKFLFWECVVVMKNSLLIIYTLGTCGGFERNHF